MSTPTTEDFATNAAMETANNLVPGPWPGPGNLAKINDPAWLGCYHAARGAYLGRFACLVDGEGTIDCTKAARHAAKEWLALHVGRGLNAQLY